MWPNGPNLHQMAPNGSKWLQMAPNGSIWLQMAPNGSKWLPIAPNGSKRLQMAPNRSKWLQITPNDSKWHMRGPIVGRLWHFFPVISCFFQFHPIFPIYSSLILKFYTRSLALDCLGLVLSVDQTWRWGPLCEPTYSFALGFAFWVLLKFKVYTLQCTLCFVAKCYRIKNVNKPFK